MKFEQVPLVADHDRVRVDGVEYTLDHVSPEGCSLYQCYDFRDAASFVNGRVVSGVCVVDGCSMEDIPEMWSRWSRGSENPHPAHTAPTHTAPMPRPLPCVPRPDPLISVDSGESEDEVEDDASSADTDDVADPVTEG